METKLLVDHGRVNCPRRGDIDVEICYTCRELLDVRNDGGADVVVCDAHRRMAYDQMVVGLP